MPTTLIHIHSTAHNIITRPQHLCQPTLMALTHSAATWAQPPPATQLTTHTGNMHTTSNTVDMRTSSNTLGITTHWYHIHHRQHCTLMQCLAIMRSTWCNLPKLHTMLDAAHLTYTVDLFHNIYNSPHKNLPFIPISVQWRYSYLFYFLLVVTYGSHFCATKITWSYHTCPP